MCPERQSFNAPKARNRGAKPRRASDGPALWAVALSEVCATTNRLTDLVKIKRTLRPLAAPSHGLSLARRESGGSNVRRTAIPLREEVPGRAEKCLA
jgi:hypothetical protein